MRRRVLGLPPKRLKDHEAYKCICGGRAISISYTVAWLLATTATAQSTASTTLENGGRHAVKVEDLLRYRPLGPAIIISEDRKWIFYSLRESSLGDDRDEFVIYKLAMPSISQIDGRDRYNEKPIEILRTGSHFPENFPTDGVTLFLEKNKLYALHRPLSRPFPVLSSYDVGTQRWSLILTGDIPILSASIRSNGEVSVVGFDVDALSRKVRSPSGRIMTAADDFIAIQSSAKGVFPFSPTIMKTYFRGRLIDVKPGTPVGHLNLKHGTPDAVQSGEIEVGVLQSEGNSPEIYARVLGGRKKLVITELNPQLRTQALGRAQTTSWKYKGVDYSGTIIFPPSYSPGKKLPCLVVPKSWRSGGFFYESQEKYRLGSLPVQALASEGIILLMLNRDGISHGDFGPVDGHDIVLGFEGAREELVARGLAIKERCGILGFSHTGWQVEFAISHWQHAVPWAAAAVIDTYSEDYGAANLLGEFRAQSYFLRNLKWSPADLEQLRTVDDARTIMLQRSPAWNASKIRSPLLIEHHYGIEITADLASEMWRRGKPLELVWLDGAHTLKRPSERRASMQRMLDWFAFWLRDKDPGGQQDDPERQSRWARLRQQHDRNELWIKAGKDPNQEWWRVEAARTMIPASSGEEER